jgi:hypothetical protein
MNDSNKPKLELQVNIPKKIQLLQATPVVGENQYGKWWLYNVFSDDKEQSFFAPEQVVNFISENNLKRNSELEITKRLVKNGRKNVADFEISIVQNGTAQGNGNPGSPELPSSDEQYQVSSEFKTMFKSMNEALMLRDKLGGDVDVSKIGITLFLTKIKS